MKLLLIGHTGTLGQLLVEGFQQLPEVELITASRSSGDHQVEIADAASVSQLLQLLEKWMPLFPLREAQCLNPLRN